MNYGEIGAGGTVPDILNHGNGPPYIQECICPEPYAQLISLHNPWGNPQRNPEGTITVLWAAHVDPPPPPIHAVNRIPTLCRTMQGDAKTEGKGGK